MERTDGEKAVRFIGVIGKAWRSPLYEDKSIN